MIKYFIKINSQYGTLEEVNPHRRREVFQSTLNHEKPKIESFCNYNTLLDFTQVHWSFDLR